MLCLPARAHAPAEHLGEQSSYSLQQYLAIGQFDGGLDAAAIWGVIHTAIFVHHVRQQQQRSHSSGGQLLQRSHSRRVEGTRTVCR